MKRRPALVRDFRVVAPRLPRWVDLDSGCTLAVLRALKVYPDYEPRCAAMFEAVCRWLPECEWWDVMEDVPVAETTVHPGNRGSTIYRVETEEPGLEHVALWLPSQKLFVDAALGTTLQRNIKRFAEVSPRKTPCYPKWPSERQHLKDTLEPETFAGAFLHILYQTDRAYEERHPGLRLSKLWPGIVPVP